MALSLIVGIVPLTLGLIAFTEVMWTFHALTALTRQGARYAATHCWLDDSGTNVVNWMQANSPAFPDRAAGVQIRVSYWTHNPVTQESEPFVCDGGCGECVPDSVTVSIVEYQFNHFFVVLGLQPLQAPPFSTTVEMQSARDPELMPASP